MSLLNAHRWFLGQPPVRWAGRDEPFLKKGEKMGYSEELENGIQSLMFGATVDREALIKLQAEKLVIAFKNHIAQGTAIHSDILSCLNDIVDQQILAVDKNRAEHDRKTVKEKVVVKNKKQLRRLERFRDNIAYTYLTQSMKTYPDPERISKLCYQVADEMVKAKYEKN